MRGIILIISAFFFLSSCQNEKDSMIRSAIENQLQTYPQSTLKDIYKNFFQDRFGPGHLINDASSARNYLQSEMDSYSDVSGEMAEPAGWQKNFYRVNLGAVKNGLISSDALLDALIRSANEAEAIPIEQWKKEWSQIESIVKSMNLSLPDYDKDSDEIKKRLDEGIYVGHHSDTYRELYSPHYRIISRKIFEEEILPLIEDKMGKL